MTPLRQFGPSRPNEGECYLCDTTIFIYNSFQYKINSDMEEQDHILWGGRTPHFCSWGALAPLFRRLCLYVCMCIHVFVCVYVAVKWLFLFCKKLNNLLNNNNKILKIKYLS